MRGFGFASAAAVAISAASFFIGHVAADVDPIVIKGSKFFYKTNGTQFFIKGVAYQQDVSGGGTAADTEPSSDDYQDPLADADGCRRDIPVMQQLQTNTIRVYAIDPTKDHDECMNMLADAGIYVILDLSQPGESINRNDPRWDDELYARYASVVDATANYTNLLGYFAGNEVSNAPNNTQASVFVKAAVRDMKSYIKAQGHREIGVGYATNDDADIRVDMADYFNCGDESVSIDFWGYNIYSWCGESSYTESGYDVRTEEFSKYNVPSFFAEYGCNTGNGPRPFTEVQALFGPKMSPVWSGGIVYMYFQEANDYGLVKVDGNTVSKLPDFENLSSQIAKASPSGVNMNSYQPSNSAAACPTTNSAWNAAASPMPPTPNKDLCSCMYDSLTCVVKSSVDEESYGKLFNQVCGYPGKPCAGIAANGTTGTFGAYGMCNSTEQLAFAFDAYYQAQGSSGNGASACNFGGSASTKAATKPSGTCASLMKQAGTAGTGTVTSSPTGTGSAHGSGGNSGSNDGSASTEGAGVALRPGTMETGLLQLICYLAIAGFTGAGMVLL
ncbi:carbohydrate-binding module family 43 protein [Polychaeton citri CBS 116435]|uniref:1,3-beta-glucanosyltransferase n=1 Tax=Polychaeton citri CBS 116435 TaxID=1314669 RepID=A0A9P4Q1B0_9PEZI|nr:carbohydrate-binding module family 43 protein [Polychaeton citri CBS 116435]